MQARGQVVHHRGVDDELGREVGGATAREGGAVGIGTEEELGYDENPLETTNGIKKRQNCISKITVSKCGRIHPMKR